MKQQEIHEAFVTVQEEAKTETVPVAQDGSVEVKAEEKKSVNKKVRIACISDTHNKHASLVIPEVDILIVAGDFTGRGRPKEIQEFNRWLGTIPIKHKIVIAGNHDFAFEDNPEMARSWLTDCVYLED